MKKAKYLGIDIGGTTAKYAIVDNEGIIGERNQFQTGINCSEERFVNNLLNVIQENLDGLEGIGVCILGIVDTDSGVIRGGVDNMPFLKGLNIKELLYKNYGVPVHLVNDANAVARGELWLGAGKGCKNFFCITFGTGIGGSIVLNTNIYEGSHLHAGEIGYLNYCSDDDYLERHISTKAVIEKTASRLKRDDIDGVEFFKLVRVGDKRIKTILDEWLYCIAETIANIIIFLDPEKVIIGGGISVEFKILIPQLTTLLNRMLPSEFKGHTVIEVAKYSNDAGILGAVSYFVF